MELIEREMLRRRVKTECNPYGKPTIDFESGNKVLTIIDNEPAVDAVPVVYGRWKGEGMGAYYCSLCNETVSGNLAKFCPNCGAHMNAEKGNEHDG